MFWSAAEAMVRNLSGAKLINVPDVNKAGARVRLKGSYPNSQVLQKLLIYGKNSHRRRLAVG